MTGRQFGTYVFALRWLLMAHLQLGPFEQVVFLWFKKNSNSTRWCPLISYKLGYAPNL